MSSSKHSRTRQRPATTSTRSVPAGARAAVPDSARLPRPSNRCASTRAQGTTRAPRRRRRGLCFNGHPQGAATASPSELAHTSAPVRQAFPGVRVDAAVDTQAPAQPVPDRAPLPGEIRPTGHHLVAVGARWCRARGKGVGKRCLVVLALLARAGWSGEADREGDGVRWWPCAPR